MSASAPWSLHRGQGLCWITCDALAGLAPIAHTFSTRCAEDGDFDVGPSEGPSGLHAARLERLLDTAGLGGQRLYRLRQVHGARVAAGESCADAAVEADGVIERREAKPRGVLGVRTADCVPILIADREGRALAAVHAGWRGTAERIAEAAVRRFEELRVSADRLVAVLGPSIGPCCYEVGAPVATAVEQACEAAPGIVAFEEEGRIRLDLRAANRRQLELAGVGARSIHAAPWCTACHRDLFFSYRRDGSTGRLIACIGWRGVS